MLPQYLFLFFSICVCLSCSGRGDRQHLSVTDEPVHYDERQIDSIMEAFEIQADEAPERYLHNPDSFLHSVPAVPQTPFQKTAYANGMLFMAYTLRENGDNFDSIRFYEKVLHYLAENSEVAIDRFTYVIRPLANLYVRIDDNDKAIGLLEDVLPQVNDSDEKHAFQISLANSYLFSGNADKAKELLLPLVEQAKSSDIRVLAYNTLASAYLATEDTTSSIRYNKLAFGEFGNRKLRNERLLWYTSALALKGELYGDNQALHEAESLLDRYFPTSQQRVKARYALINGDIYRAKRRPARSREQYQKALRLLAPLSLLTQDGLAYTRDYTYTQALFGLAQGFEQENQVDSALYFYQWAIENDFRTQQLITSKADQLKNNRWHREHVERMVNLIAAQLASPDADHRKLKAQLFWCIELSKARLLINEINRSEVWASAPMHTRQAIQRIRKLYGRQDRSENLEEKKAIQALIDKLLLDFRLSERYFETLNFDPRQEVFLENLSRSGTDYYAYFVHQDHQVSIVSKVEGIYHYDRIRDTALMAEVDRVKKEYFGNSPAAYRDNPDAYRQRTQRLARQLLPHSRAGDRTIYASLDGDLYGLPLDALWDGDFLIHHYQIAYLNSFLLFDLLPSEHLPDPRITLLYRSEYPDPLPDLHFVPKEAARIGNLFHTLQIPPEKQVDTIVSDVFATSDVVHIAAHTVIDAVDQAPLLYLGQRISTHQIRFYQMRTPLVFLSACNTGSGSALPAEGTESIQRVFLSKGVPSVISTYWFANDEAMLQLTADFYQQLARVGLPEAALAQAKRNYLANAGSEQQNPWYWANINYTGVGNEIGLKKTSNLSTSLYVFLCLSGAALVIFFLRQRLRG